MYIDQNPLTAITKNQTWRALWEVKNVIDCVPDELWDKTYCTMSYWKHIYHMLHSLDLWLISPRDRMYQEPEIHEKDLNNLDVISEKRISRAEMDEYVGNIDKKIRDYTLDLKDAQLLDHLPDCEYDRFTLLLAQSRHLHSHMGTIMGFTIGDTRLWPRVLGLEHPIPEGEYSQCVS